MALEWFICFFIGALFSGAVVALLYWDEICDWVYSKFRYYDDYGEIIKREMSNGNVRIVAGVFNRYGTRIATEAWEAESLDYEMRQKFGYRDRIIIR